MPIIYPSSTGGTTVVSQRPQYAVPATVNITYPLVISSSTSPTYIGDLFFPPQFLYQTSGSFSISVVGFVTGTAGATASLEIQGESGAAYAYLTENNPFAPFGSNGPMATRFSSSVEGNIVLNLNNVSGKGFAAPINISGSISDYTASIYGIYFSPTS